MSLSIGGSDRGINIKESRSAILNFGYPGVVFFGGET